MHGLSNETGFRSVGLLVGPRGPRKEKFTTFDGNWKCCELFFFQEKCSVSSTLFQNSAGPVPIERGVSGQAIQLIVWPLAYNFICGIIHARWDVFRHLPILTNFRPIYNHDKASYGRGWGAKRAVMIKQSSTQKSAESDHIWRRTRPANLPWFRAIAAKMAKSSLYWFFLAQIGLMFFLKGA